MKIENIIIYGKNDNARIIPFNTEGVSIISGESKTGKTSLIYIIDFCLGSGRCDVAEGVIRDNSEWFSITILVNEERIFIARQNPNFIGGIISADVCIIRDLEHGEFLARSQVTVNSNVSSLRYLLESLIGIGDYVHEAKTNTRDSLKVSFKHSRIYCFQPQDLIAQKNVLFFHQNTKDGSFISQSIKDTIPYFLGAVSENYVYLKNILAAKKREFRKLKRDLQSYQSITSAITSNLLEIAEEAKSIGLLPSTYIPEQEIDLLQKLKQVVQDFDVLQDKGSAERIIIERLVEERRALGKHIDNLNSEIAAIEMFRNDTSFYIQEASLQIDRLKSVGLYKNSGRGWNSILGVESDYIPAQISKINKRLEILLESLENTVREKPKVTEFIQLKESEIQSLREEMVSLSTRINAAYEANAELERVRDLNIRKGQVLGKIDLVVESYYLSQDDTSLRSRLNSLESEIEIIEAELSDEIIADRLLSSLNTVNLSMSNWIGLLDIEYNRSPTRFDIGKLMVYADTPNRSIPLSDMGSAANWVSYHLLIHFALHKFFVERNSSVPRFLFIDQPTQAYYPPSDIVSVSGVGENSDDIAVRKMYDFIFERVEELNGGLQVILTDHAMLSGERFENALIEVWRNEKKLIPIEWL